jgi:hypothetical protein
VYVKRRRAGLRIRKFRARIAVAKFSSTTKHPGSPLLIISPGETPLGFEPEDRDKVRSVDQGFVFGSLVSSQMALVCAFTKHFDSRQHLWVYSERHQTPSRFGVETGTRENIVARILPIPEQIADD